MPAPGRSLSFDHLQGSDDAVHAQAVRAFDQDHIAFFQVRSAGTRWPRVPYRPSLTDHSRIPADSAASRDQFSAVRRPPPARCTLRPRARPPFHGPIRSYWPSSSISPRTATRRPSISSSRLRAARVDFGRGIVGVIQQQRAAFGVDGHQAQLGMARAAAR